MSITFEEGGAYFGSWYSPPLWGRHCSVKNLAVLPAVRQQNEMNAGPHSIRSAPDPSPGDGFTHI